MDDHRINSDDCREPLVGGFLLHPKDRWSCDGRSLLFIWDMLDAHPSTRQYRLIVKPRWVGQSADEAFRDNVSLIEEDVEFVQFLALDVGRLGRIQSDFVWRVAVTGSGPDDNGHPLAVSEIRNFSCQGNRSGLDRVVSPSIQLEDEVAARKKPKVPKGRVAAACPNGDLETGTFQNWKGFYGSRSLSPTVNLNNLQQGIVNGRHTIVSAGLDPVLAGLGASLPLVGEGSYAARLGDSTAGGSADVLAYTFMVNAQNQNFSFRYAVVLEDGGHGPESQPFFTYYIVKGSSIFFGPGNMPIGVRQVVADPNNPFFSSKGSIVYRNWTPVCVDLSDYVGQTMTIVFIVTDCSAGQHFGYAYVDGLCVSNAATATFDMPSEICASADLWADGSASTGETSHFWSIEESDANWGRKPQTEVSEWFVAKQAGPINLTAFYASKGKTFKCNTYYRVKLAVQNDCTPWNESVRLLFARCPKVPVGTDACVSCVPDGKFLTLGTGSPGGGYSYSWSPTIGLSNPNIPRPQHAHGSVTYPFTYTLTVTDPTGCSASASVTLYCRPPHVLLKMVEECCSVTLLSQAKNYSSLAWSTGETGVDTIRVTQPGTYTVFATNACAGVSQSITVPPTQGLVGPFNPVAAESKVGSSPYPGAMHIKDVIIGSPAGIAGVPHAYNATHYRLEIFDRWGQVVRTIADENCLGFANWSIEWDTTNNWGNPVPQGTYTWRLELKNCQRDWGTPDVRRFKSVTASGGGSIFSASSCFVGNGTFRMEPPRTSRAEWIA